MRKSNPIIEKVICNTSMHGNIQKINSQFEVTIEVFTPYPIDNAAISYQIINSVNQPVIHILNLSDDKSSNLFFLETFNL